MGLGHKRKAALDKLAKERRNGLLFSLRQGTGRSAADSEYNYAILKELLADLRTDPVTDPDADQMTEAAAGVVTALGLTRGLEATKPTRDAGAALLAELEGCSSAVRGIIDSIDVRLDNDQLKHQHPNCPIGTRKTGHGNTFVQTCDAAWHQENTLPHMAEWAGGLGNLVERTKVFHGQAEAVGEVHYEGFCVMVKATIYVLFHCYPSDDSDLRVKGGRKQLQKEMKAS